MFIRMRGCCRCVRFGALPDQQIPAATCEAKGGGLEARRTQRRAERGRLRRGWRQLEGLIDGSSRGGQRKKTCNTVLIIMFGLSSGEKSRTEDSDLPRIGAVAAPVTVLK